MTRAEGLGKEEFLARLAGPAGGRLPPPLMIDAERFRLVHTEDDLVARFTLEAEAAGSRVHAIGGDGLCVALEEILASVPAGKATVSMAPGEDSHTVRQALKAAGCAEVDWRLHSGIEAHYDVDVGITDVAAALAETGSLILRSDAEHSRGAHLAPPTHIAIVHARQILADMLDLFPDEHIDPMPSSMVIITGPSKTADIEGVLITGVHGPGAVHVLLLRQDP